MSSSAPDLLLDAQQLVIEQLEARAVSAQLAQATAHEKMVAAMNDHELAVATARRAVEAVQEVRRTFSRIVEPMLGPQLVPHPRTQPRTLHALNADVLIEIFSAWNAIQLLPEDGPYSTMHPPAFVAASVSKHWRAVALSMPSLWTDVYLDFRDACFKDLENYLELVTTRARHLALDVHIVNALAHSRSAVIADELMVRLLTRCRTLDISFLDERLDFHDSMLALLQTEMPQLEKAILRLSYDNVKDINRASESHGMLILTLCPKLRILDTGELSLRFIDPKTLPYLESYTTESHLDLDDLVKATRIWQNLTTMEVDSVGTSAIGLFTGVAKIDLPLLEALVCRHSDHPLPSTSPERVPALKRLDIFATEQAWPGFDSFFRHPHLATSLTTLNLSATYDTPIIESWASTIINVINLESLSLREFSELGLVTFFRSWTLTSSLPTKLHDMHVIRCQFTGYSIERFVDWLGKRNTSTIGHSPIKTLRIEQNGSDQPTSDLFPSWMLPRLSQFVEDVSIHDEETYAPAYLGAHSD
ncbi:hypothetical protein EXIGLDRAFT_841607 [Exidia glandulosa HHB12029]|uniref:F-box domain-containing protein n=1 Tax=Exidia glandulosa HHB12029 TaxID=1314781 RepID=A0A165DS91_EXIGL|nr:hypothetical protein EXIGLDRAFT_841607 [Exidia glandulosa HHB12029]